jgi:hypothetical protein
MSFIKDLLITANGLSGKKNYGKTEQILSLKELALFLL